MVEQIVEIVKIVMKKYAITHKMIVYYQIMAVEMIENVQMIVM